MNLMEDGVLAKEAIDVKKGRKKEERIQLQRMDRMEEEQIWKKKEREVKKLLVFDVATQSIGFHRFHLITKLSRNS